MELGLNANNPYGGQSWYLSNAQFTENQKFVKMITDNIPRLRMIDNVAPTDIYPNTQTQAKQIWIPYVKAYSPSTYILYGATNNTSGGFNPPNFLPFKAYLLLMAAWAQGNGVDAFCVINEPLINSSHVTNAVTLDSLSRSGNVATGVKNTGHGLTTGDRITISGASPSNFNVSDSETAETVQVTVVNSTTFTYPSTGSDGAATGTIKMNWSALEVVRKCKDLVSAVQAIFTNGPVVASESQGHQQAWITVGITTGITEPNRFLFAINGYGSGSNEANFVAWKATIDQCFAAFGSKLILTELNVVQDSGDVKPIANFSKKKKGVDWWFEIALMRRFNYCKRLGISQIYLYGANENPLFANTWPVQNDGTNYDNAYYEGTFKPIIDRLRGRRKRHVFFGTYENNGVTGF